MSEDIKWMQTRLNQLGANLTVDGQWGSLSRAAFITVMANKNAKAITEAELLEVAKALGDTNTKRIKAVATVEAAGGGWFDSGLPKILWERHKFWSFVSAIKRKISWFANPKAGDYTMDANKNGINDSWEKLSFAIGVDPLSALKSISIGKFQVMGWYYRELGYDHPFDMLLAARDSEKAHYDMLKGYILNVAKIKPAFLALSTNSDSCVAFARGYNGAGFSKNQYHIKLARAMR